MSKYYLAYGSNMNLKQMAIRCPKAKLLGTSILNNYELNFKGSENSGVATIEKKENCEVPVVLWEITSECEKALDRYEGFPNLYRKEKIKIMLNEKALTAMVYIMNDLYETTLPNSHYYNVILQGYRDNKISPKSLNRVINKIKDSCYGRNY